MAPKDGDGDDIDTHGIGSAWGGGYLSFLVFYVNYVLSTMCEP
jgi:hypothetical protein